MHPFSPCQKVNLLSKITICGNIWLSRQRCNVVTSYYYAGCIHCGKHTAKSGHVHGLKPLRTSIGCNLSYMTVGTRTDESLMQGVFTWPALYFSPSIQGPHYMWLQLKRAMHIVSVQRYTQLGINTVLKFWLKMAWITSAKRPTAVCDCQSVWSNIAHKKTKILPERITVVENRWQAVT